MKASPQSDGGGGWVFGVYGTENVAVVGAELAELGHPLMYQMGEFTVAIPQFDLVSELSGAVIDVLASGALVVRTGA